MSQEDRRFTCMGCGAELAGEADGQPRQPCPHCGDIRRQIGIHITEQLKISGRAVLHRPPSDSTDQSEGVRVAGFGTRSASADVSASSASYEIAGDAPRNEDGALETAQILVRKLRESDAGWSHPMMVDFADVDCESRNGGDTLSMQVTRVPRSSSFWRDLGRQSVASEVGSADDLANELMSAINHKAARLASRQRAVLSLVLDARDMPAFAATRAAARFSELHRTEATNLGFRSIWVVGPTVTLVRQLA